VGLARSFFDLSGIQLKKFSSPKIFADILFNLLVDKKWSVIKVNHMVE